MFENLFRTVLTMSAGATVVIAAVLLLRLVLKKAPKVCSYALWAVVLLRLLCPVFPETSLSLVPRADSVAAIIADRTAVAEATDRTVKQAPGEMVVADTATAEQAQSSGRTQISVQNQQQEKSTLAADVADRPTGLRLSGWEIGGIVWLTGIWIVAFYGVWSLFRLKSRLVGAVDMGNGVYQADHIDTPFVIGFIKPKIYLPSCIQEDQAAYIILHERHHIHRLDHVMKLLFFGALCLHWFNPLVWLAFILMGHDMEMSCDEAVMAQMNRDVRGDYAASLLQLSTRRRKIVPTPLAFGEGDPKGRIKNVLNYRKPYFWVAAAAVVVCVIAAVCLLTDPVSKNEESEYLNYPGLSWGMTPEDVITALNLQEGQYDQKSDSQLTVPQMNCFGAETQYVQFWFPFSEVSGSKLRLRNILIVYPDDADMDAVKDELIGQYGEPSEEHVFASIGSSGLKVVDGKSEFYDDRGIDLKQMLTTAHDVYWDSDATLGELYTGLGQEYESGGSLTNRMEQMLLDNAPACFIYWTDDHGDDVYTASIGEKYKNFVMFTVGHVGG